MGQEINLVVDEPVYAYHIAYLRGERRIVEHVHGSMVVENAGGLSIYRNGICVRHYQPAAAAVQPSTPPPAAATPAR